MGQVSDENLRYLVDHFGNVVLLFGLLAGSIRYLWKKIEGRIEQNNEKTVAGQASMVSELKGIREDLSKEAAIRTADSIRITALEASHARFEGQIGTLLTALSGVLVLREHKE
jgi:hypothetical protein